MCGRYTLTAEQEKVETTFAAKFEKGKGYRKRWNAAPTQMMPVITDSERGAIRHYEWGLVPGWSKTPQTETVLINARVETLSEKPSFRYAFQQQRCLVLADGYYEWRVMGKDRIPHWLHLPGQGLFAMAGLWEKWQPVAQSGEQETKWTFAIVTLAAPERLAHIHDRIPAILPNADAWEAWLNPNMPDEALFQLLEAQRNPPLHLHTVAKKVNSARAEGQELIDPYTHTIQGSLF